MHSNWLPTFWRCRSFAPEVLPKINPTFCDLHCSGCGAAEHASEGHQSSDWETGKG